MPALQEHLERVRRLHQKDLAAGGGSVYLPKNRVKLEIGTGAACVVGSSPQPGKAEILKAESWNGK
jgi:hypothetical protein